MTPGAGGSAARGGRAGSGEGSGRAGSCSTGAGTSCGMMTGLLRTIGSGAEVGMGSLKPKGSEACAGGCDGSATGACSGEVVSGMGSATAGGDAGCDAGSAVAATFARGDGPTGAASVSAAASRAGDSATGLTACWTSSGGGVCARAVSNFKEFFDDDRESLPTCENERPVDARRATVVKRFLNDFAGAGEAGRLSEPEIVSVRLGVEEAIDVGDHVDRGGLRVAVWRPCSSVVVDGKTVAATYILARHACQAFLEACAASCSTTHGIVAIRLPTTTRAEHTCRETHEIMADRRRAVGINIGAHNTVLTPSTGYRYLQA